MSFINKLAVCAVAVAMSACGHSEPKPSTMLVDAKTTYENNIMSLPQFDCPGQVLPNIQRLWFVGLCSDGTVLDVHLSDISDKSLSREMEINDEVTEYVHDRTNIYFGTVPDCNRLTNWNISQSLAASYLIEGNASIEGDSLYLYGATEVPFYKGDFSGDAFYGSIKGSSQVLLINSSRDNRLDIIQDIWFPEDTKMVLYPQYVFEKLFQSGAYTYALTKIKINGISMSVDEDNWNDVKLLGGSVGGLKLNVVYTGYEDMQYFIAGDVIDEYTPTEKSIVFLDPQEMEVELAYVEEEEWCYIETISDLNDCRSRQDGLFGIASDEYSARLRYHNRWLDFKFDGADLSVVDPDSNVVFIFSLQKVEVE